MHAQPLLALTNVSVTASAGISGLAFCSVRLLDRVSVTIAAGELVLLRGGYDHGSATLLNVIAGDMRLDRRVTGDRYAAPGLLVRSGCVPASAIAPMIHCWTSDAPLNMRYPPREQRQHVAPMLVLLRTTYRPTPNEFSLDDWLHWCVQHRKRGGTIVIAERLMRSREQEPFALQLSLPRTTVVKDDYPRIGWRSPSNRMHHLPRVSENRMRCPCQRPVVRILQLGFGRLFGEEAHAARLCRACSERAVRLQ